MSKRQLNSKYKDLVDYVENEDESLTEFLTEAIEEGYVFHDKGNELWRILDGLYTTPLADYEFGDLTKTIVDIFEGNYELEESKSYWKFKELRGFDRCDLYFGITVDAEPLLVDPEELGAPEECTKTELNSYLVNTNLTIDNFIPVEEIEND